MDYSALPPHEVFCVCLKTGGESAWREFIRRFHPLISRVVLRVARQWGESSPQVIDDLIQEAYLKLCSDGSHLLENFRPVREDAVYGYLKVFTANLVTDHFKRGNSLKRGGENKFPSVEEMSFDPPSRSSSSSGMDRQVLIQEVEACLRDVAAGEGAARDRRIFWLYYRIGLTAAAIAGLPTVGLTTKGVESTLLRLTRQIRERLATTKRTSASGESAGKGIQSEESF